MKLKTVLSLTSSLRITNSLGNPRHLLLSLFLCLMIITGFAQAESWVGKCAEEVYDKTGAVPLSPSKSPPLSKKDRKIFFDCCWKAYGGDVNLSNWYCLNSPNALTKRIPEYCGSPGSSCMPVPGEFAKEEPDETTEELDEIKSKGEEENCKLKRDNPCNPVTGNKFQTEVDFRSANGQLDVVRYYNSLSPQNGVFGFGWTSSLIPFLNIAISGSKGQVAIFRADGRGEVWQKENGRWSGDPDSKVNFSENQLGFIVTRPDTSIEQYNRKGRLISKNDRNGLSVQYQYDSTGRLKELIDSYFRKLTLTYNKKNQINKIITPDGQLLYDYDGRGNLIKVTYPDNTTRQYLYGEKKYVSSSPESGVSYAHALTGLIDENNVRFATWTYDEKGKVTSSEHAGGVGKGTYERKKDGNVVVSSPLGNVEIYKAEYLHNVVKLKSVTGDQCSSCGSGTSWTYDKNGNVASSTDAKDNLTCFLYDLKRNLEIIRLEGLFSGKSCPKDLAAYTPSKGENSTERKITTQWHDKFRLPITVAEPLRLTTTSYDATGRLQSQTIQATTDTSGGDGLKAQKIGEPRTTSYTYTKTGQIERIDGPRTDLSDITTFAYDKQGNLVTVTNALKQITKPGNYDPSGRPRSITDSNEVVTTLAYDLRGRLKSIKKGSEETVYTYDKAGNLINISLPGGGEYTYTYDPAHRLTDITDKDGNRIHFTLDKAGNRIKEEIKNRNGKAVQVRSREFNKLSRLVKEIGAVNNQATLYEYDDNGNLTKITDPLKRTVANQYDALNRLITSTDPEGNPTHYSYDSQDQLVWVTDPRKLGTQYTRDGLNNLSKTVSPDTGTTTATFDAAGNLITRVDAKGQKAVYSYDALNRLTGISYAGAAEQNITYTYDQGKNGIGRLTGIKDVTGTVTYSYDQQGRLIREQRQSYGQNYTTIYSYDTQGRLQQIAYPSGRTINYSFDGQGRIQQITTTVANQTKTVIRNVLYHPFGGVHQFTFGNGQKYTREYDKDGRITNYTLDDTPYTIAYDAASQVTAISGDGKTANYTYDLLSRLTKYTQGSDLQSFSYDAIGNRLSKTEGRITTNYSYSSTSNQLMGLQEQGQGVKKISYDPNGSTVEDAERQYAYDAKGRLMKTVTAEGTVEYSVNAVGLRIRKKAPQSDTVYHYDRDGRLIAENATGTRKFSREYIYLGDQPVAVLR